MNKFEMGDHVWIDKGGIRLHGIIVQVRTWYSTQPDMATEYGVETEAQPDLLWMRENDLEPFHKNLPAYVPEKKPRIEKNTLYVRNGIKTAQVYLETTMPDGDYHVSVQIENMRDANPQIIHGLVTQKSSTHFTVELSHLTDSDNYKISYVAMHNIATMSDMSESIKRLMEALEAGSYNAKGKALKIKPEDLDNADLVAFDKDTGKEVGRITNVSASGDSEIAKPECRNHVWKSYTGLMEKYDYCEVCDCKRGQGT